MTAPARRPGFLSRIALTWLSATLMALAPIGAQSVQARSGQVDEAKYAAIVMDAATGEILYARQADSKRFPASVTKIMTLYLTFEALSKGQIKLTDRVMVSPHAAAQPPSKLGLAAGESASVDEAIRAMCTKSANDMAVAMAEKLGGSEQAFAAMMTRKAAELGMSNTHYADASGLPDARQISTAHDIAILSRAVLRDFPAYYPYFSEASWTFHGRSERNHNHLLEKEPGVDGIKTGYTNGSGFNLAASAKRDGRRMIVVVLGGSSASSRDAHVVELLNAGFDVMHRRELGEKVTLAQRLIDGPQATPYATLAALPDGPTSNEPPPLHADHYATRAGGQGDRVERGHVRGHRGRIAARGAHGHALAAKKPAKGSKLAHGKAAAHGKLAHAKPRHKTA